MLKFTNDQLQIIALALSIARKNNRLGCATNDGKSFMSWKQSATSTAMERLESEINEHLAQCDEDEL